MTHEVHIVTDKGLNEFSYEDEGQLSLHFFMLMLMGSLLGMMMKTFVRFYRVEKSLMAPHPIIVMALFWQVVSICLQMVHLWYYASNGHGSTLADVSSKLFHGLSEVTMSLLLVTMASGWKLKY